MASKVAVDQLVTASDWLDAEKLYQTLLDFTPDDPWQNCTHCRSMQEVFWPDEPLWLITVTEDSALLLMSILRLEKTGGLEKKVLRSVDAMVLYTDSLWCAPRHKRRALAILTRNLKTLARPAGCDALKLYRQSSQAADSSDDTVKKQLFTTALQIDLREGIAPWYEHLGQKRLRDIRRRGRKLAAEADEEVSYSRLRGNLFAREGFSSTWQRYEELRRSSWQLQESEASGKSSIDGIERYVRAMARYWSEHEILELAELTIGQKPAASHLNILLNDRIWMYVMNHDARWRSYGVGMQLLLAMIEDEFQQGAALFELGGEANDWKLSYTNNSVPVYSLRYSLPTLRGIARRTLDAVRRPIRNG